MAEVIDINSTTKISELLAGNYDADKAHLQIPGSVNNEITKKYTAVDIENSIITSTSAFIDKSLKQGFAGLALEIDNVMEITETQLHELEQAIIEALNVAPISNLTNITENSLDTNSLKGNEIGDLQQLFQQMWIRIAAIRTILTNSVNLTGITSAQSTNPSNGIDLTLARSKVFAQQGVENNINLPLPLATSAMNGVMSSTQASALTSAYANSLSGCFFSETTLRKAVPNITPININTVKTVPTGGINVLREQLVPLKSLVYDSSGTVAVVIQVSDSSINVITICTTNQSIFDWRMIAQLTTEQDLKYTVQEMIDDPDWVVSEDNLPKNGDWVVRAMWDDSTSTTSSIFEQYIATVIAGNVTWFEPTTPIRIGNYQNQFTIEGTQGMIPTVGVLGSGEWGSTYYGITGGASNDDPNETLVTSAVIDDTNARVAENTYNISNLQTNSEQFEQAINDLETSAQIAENAIEDLQNLTSSLGFNAISDITSSWNDDSNRESIQIITSSTNTSTGNTTSTSFILPNISNIGPGLMTQAEYEILYNTSANANARLDELEHKLEINTSKIIGFESNETNAVLHTSSMNYETGDIETSTFSVPSATATQAGTITAEEYKKLSSSLTPANFQTMSGSSESRSAALQSLHLASTSSAITINTFTNYLDEGSESQSSASFSIKSGQGIKFTEYDEETSSVIIESTSSLVEFPTDSIVYYATSSENPNILTLNIAENIRTTPTYTFMTIPLGGRVGAWTSATIDGQEVPFSPEGNLAFESNAFTSSIINQNVVTNIDFEVNTDGTLKLQYETSALGTDSVNTNSITIPYASSAINNKQDGIVTSEQVGKWDTAAGGGISQIILDGEQWGSNDSTGIWQLDSYTMTSSLMGTSAWDVIASSTFGSVMTTANQVFATNGLMEVAFDMLGGVNLISTGDGSRFLANDGNYAEISLPTQYVADIRIDDISIVESQTNIAYWSSASLLTKSSAEDSFLTITSANDNIWNKDDTITFIENALENSSFITNDQFISSTSSFMGTSAYDQFATSIQGQRADAAIPKVVDAVDSTIAIFNSDGTISDSNATLADIEARIEEIGRGMLWMGYKTSAVLLPLATDYELEGGHQGDTFDILYADDTDPPRSDFNWIPNFEEGREALARFMATSDTSSPHWVISIFKQLEADNQTINYGGSQGAMQVNINRTEPLPTPGLRILGGTGESEADGLYIDGQIASFDRIGLITSAHQNYYPVTSTSIYSMIHESNGQLVPRWNKLRPDHVFNDIPVKGTLAYTSAFTTQTDTIYTWAQLLPGIPGQVLSTGGNDSPPTWINLPATAQHDLSGSAHIGILSSSMGGTGNIYNSPNRLQSDTPANEPNKILNTSTMLPSVDPNIIINVLFEQANTAQGALTLQASADNTTNNAILAAVNLDGTTRQITGADNIMNQRRTYTFRKAGNGWELMNPDVGKPTSANWQTPTNTFTPYTYITETDLNNFTTPGIYRLISNSYTNGPAGITIGSSSTNDTAILTVYSNTNPVDNTPVIFQILHWSGGANVTGTIYQRTSNGANFSENTWRKMVDSSNFSLSGQTLNITI